MPRRKKTEEIKEDELKLYHIPEGKVLRLPFEEFDDELVPDGCVISSLWVGDKRFVLIRR